MSLAVAVQCESGVICRNVRPLEAITEEFDNNSTLYVQTDHKMGSWGVVLAFHNTESFEQYEKGDLKAPWDKVQKAEKKPINPLKASKRAARSS